jgi:hypothetical protein
MDPTVTGAAIGLAGAVIGAVGAYLATARNTSKTIEHEREKRVWERRADAYLEALAAVEYLQVTRGTVADWDPPMLEDFLRTHNTPDWEMLDARIRAFASEPVWESMQAVWKAYKALPALHLAAPLPEPSRTARIAEARVTGAAFIDLIRTELQRTERQQTRSQQRSSQDHPQRLKLELEALAIFDEQSRSG